MTTHPHSTIISWDTNGPPSPYTAHAAPLITANSQPQSLVQYSEQPLLDSVGLDEIRPETAEEPLYTSSNPTINANMHIMEGEEMRSMISLESEIRTHRNMLLYKEGMLKSRKDDAQTTKQMVAMKVEVQKEAGRSTADIRREIEALEGDEVF